jgi:16S rRNA processing protein RimM
VLIPFVQAIVPVVDLVARKVEITPPPGLLDLK